MMQNPYQIKKQLVSAKRLAHPIQVIYYLREPYFSLHEALTTIYQKFGEKAEVLFLGRTRFDLNDYFHHQLFFFPTTKKIIYTPYPDMKITYLTVHEAKGLEAQNVILLNLKQGELGFPCQKDIKTQKESTTDTEYFPFAEERRLFYVALTRTKNYVFLLAPHHKSSLFLQELKKITSIKEVVADENQTLQPIPLCPYCHHIHLRMEEENGMHYWDCPNCHFASS